MPIKEIKKKGISKLKDVIRYANILFLKNRKQDKKRHGENLKPGKIIVPLELENTEVTPHKSYYPPLTEEKKKKLLSKVNIVTDEDILKYSGKKIIFFGEDSEAHRWGCGLDEKDFFIQSKRLKKAVDEKKDIPVSIGIRRTNFFKIDKIASYILSLEKKERKELYEFHVCPPQTIRKRFWEYYHSIGDILNTKGIRLELTDPSLDDLLISIEKNSAKKNVNERDFLRALGPVCKDTFIGPKNILFNLSGRCNTRCIYCRKFTPLLGDRYKEFIKGKQALDIKTVKEVLEDAKKLQTDQILLVGEGEPTTYPYFREVLQESKKQGMTVNISTNGMLLGKYVYDLLESSCETITISMSWATEESFSKIRPTTPTRFAKVIEENVKKLSTEKKTRGKAKPNIILLHAINKLNYKEIPLMAKKVKELGANEIWFQLTHLSDFMEKHLKLSDEEMKETKRLIGQAREYCKKNDITFSSFIDFELKHYDDEKGSWSKEGMLDIGCYVGWYFSFIDLRETVSFCCGVKIISDLKKKRFIDVWNSPVYKRFRNDGLIMHKENPLDMYGKPLYDAFCESCDNHDQNNEMIKDIEKYGFTKFVER